MMQINYVNGSSVPKVVYYNGSVTMESLFICFFLIQQQDWTVGLFLDEWIRVFNSTITLILLDGVYNIHTTKNKWIHDNILTAEAQISHGFLQGVGL